VSHTIKNYLICFFYLCIANCTASEFEYFEGMSNYQTKFPHMAFANIQSFYQAYTPKKVFLSEDNNQWIIETLNIENRFDGHVFTLSMQAKPRSYMLCGLAYKEASASLQANFALNGAFELQSIKDKRLEEYLQDLLKKSRDMITIEKEVQFSPTPKPTLFGLGAMGLLVGMAYYYKIQY
jgi:hypothetical protein